MQLLTPGAKISHPSLDAESCQVLCSGGTVPMQLCEPPRKEADCETSSGMPSYDWDLSLWGIPARGLDIVDQRTTVPSAPSLSLSYTQAHKCLLHSFGMYASF